MMSKVSMSRLAPAALALTLLTAGATHAAELKRVTIGTNPSGTNYYVIGGGMAKAMQETLNIPSTVQPYAGSSVYLPLIENGDVTMGMSSSLDSGGAYRGDQGRKPMPKLRALARLWPLPYAFVVRGDSGMKTVADLKGKKVITEYKANISLSPLNVAMLEASGLGKGDYTPVEAGGIPQGTKALIEGKVAGVASAIGIPLLREAHASTPGGIRYLTMTGPNVTDDFIRGKEPGAYLYTVKPGPNYPGLEGETVMTAFDVFMIVSADMSDEDAAEVLGVLYDQWEGLQKDYAVLRAAPRESLGLASNTVPYHPGAVKFFKAKGLWKDTNDKHDQMLAKK
jgi:uncharacterized protein